MTAWICTKCGALPETMRHEGCNYLAHPVSSLSDAEREQMAEWIKENMPYPPELYPR